MNRLQLSPFTASPARLLQLSRGIIFDMDGVLIDSEPVHEEAWTHLSEQMGRRFEKTEARCLRGMTEEATLRRLMGLFPDQGRSFEELTTLRQEIYRGIAHEVEAMAGARDFVRRCSELGYAIGLATSSLRASQQRVFDQFGLHGYFHATVTGDEVTQGKPHPEPYLKVAGELGLRPEECVVIEDSINGIYSGKAAGCRVIGLTTSFPEIELREAGADFTVNSFRELASGIS